jgi:hypothetical protein
MRGSHADARCQPVIIKPKIFLKLKFYSALGHIRINLQKEAVMELDQSTDGPGEVDDFCGRAGRLNIDRNGGLASYHVFAEAMIVTLVLTVLRLEPWLKPELPP